MWGSKWEGQTWVSLEGTLDTARKDPRGASVHRRGQTLGEASSSAQGRCPEREGGEGNRCRRNSNRASKSGLRVQGLARDEEQGTGQVGPGQVAGRDKPRRQSSQEPEPPPERSESPSAIGRSWGSTSSTPPKSAHFSPSPSPGPRLLEQRARAPPLLTPAHTASPPENRAETGNHISSLPCPILRTCGFWQHFGCSRTPSQDLNSCTAWPLPRSGAPLLFPSHGKEGVRGMVRSDHFWVYEEGGAQRTCRQKGKVKLETLSFIPRLGCSTHHSRPRSPEHSTRCSHLAPGSPSPVPPTPHSHCCAPPHLAWTLPTPEMPEGPACCRLMLCAPDTPSVPRGPGMCLPELPHTQLPHRGCLAHPRFTLITHGTSYL